MTISAPAAVLEFDTRNNLFTPTNGIFAESVYLVSREDFGATEEFERFQQVVMGWWPIGDQWTLGLRGDYQWASDGTPFFLRPYIKLRGVEAMRYQGDDMASGGSRGAGSCAADGVSSARRVTEPRIPNGTCIPRPTRSSGAVGFRYELARKFGLHAGVDVGFSSGRRRSISRSEMPGSGPDRPPLLTGISCTIPAPKCESRGAIHELRKSSAALRLAALAAISVASFAANDKKDVRPSSRLSSGSWRSQR